MASNKDKDNEKYPLHCRKIPLKEDVITKGIQAMMEEQGYILNEDSALDLFKNIIGNLVCFLYRNPGFYLQLGMVDIDSKDDNFLIVKKSSRYSKDTVTPLSIFNNFAGENRARKELEKHLDKFAEALIGKRKKINTANKRMRQNILTKYAISMQVLKDIDDAIANNELAKAKNIAKEAALDAGLKLRTKCKSSFVDRNVIDVRKHRAKKNAEEDQQIIEKEDFNFPDDLLDT